MLCLRAQREYVLTTMKTFSFPLCWCDKCTVWLSEKEFDK